MDDVHERLTNPNAIPDEDGLKDFLGAAHANWLEIHRIIGRNYPNLFEPEWLFAGKKYGWCQRFKRSRPLCTLVPERGRLMALIVLGARERAAVEDLLPELSEPFQREYRRATTYPDGKWMFVALDGEPALRDFEKLMAIKRKPKVPAMVAA